jgi:hypothetical protein
MVGKINEFISWAKNNGWNITTEKNNIIGSSENTIIKCDIPAEYITFLENIKICTNKDNTIWFLCINDYFEQSRAYSLWDEYKTMSEENIFFWIDKDENLTERYFNTIFPIVFNVNGEYGFLGNFKYYGINIETGEIIVGYGPEFEEKNKIVANNSEMFLTKIINEEIIL